MCMCDAGAVILQNQYQRFRISDRRPLEENSSRLLGSTMKNFSGEPTTMGIGIAGKSPVAFCAVDFYAYVQQTH